MAVQAPSVEGPEFVEKVRRAEEITRKLEANQWDFNSAPEIFGRSAACDVLAKEMVFIHNGHTLTRIGRLVMQGVGDNFNLMGPETSASVLTTTSSHLLDEVNRQIGSQGLQEFKDFREFGRPQEVEFNNFTTFYQPRDIVFWSALYECGLFPSGFEIMMRNMAAGKIVHNTMFSPGLRSPEAQRPSIMQGTCLMLQTRTPVVEWMEKPIFGGMVKETIHIVNLLTTEPTKVSHPDLPLTAEGAIEYCGQHYYLRRFVGVSPKDGLRGPGVSPEGSKVGETR